MSKRFGRNQKRAMQERINDAAKAVVYQKDITARLGRELMSERERMTVQNEAILFTREVLGEFFATLPPMEKHLHTGVDVLDVPVSKPVSGFVPYSECVNLIDSVVRFEKLEAIRHDIQENFEDLRGMMHVRFRTGAGLMSYAFSPNSFRGMPRQRVASIIADGLRRYMLENRSFFDRLGVK